MQMSEFEFGLTDRLHKLTKHQLVAFAATFFDNWVGELEIDPDHSLTALDTIIAHVPTFDRVDGLTIRNQLHHWHTHTAEILGPGVWRSHERRKCEHCGATKGYGPPFEDEDADDSTDQEECDE